MREPQSDAHIQLEAYVERGLVVRRAGEGSFLRLMEALALPCSPVFLGRAFSGWRWLVGHLVEPSHCTVGP